MIIYNSDGAEVLNIIPDDTSYAYREIMGDGKLVLNFSLVEYVDIPVGSWCDFNGVRYTLLKPSSVKIVHRRNYEYALELGAPDTLLSLYKFREIVMSEDTGEFGGSRRLKFSLTAKPKEHLAMIVANMNQREMGGWSIGDCIDKSEVSITYSHASVLDALKQLATECETEYEVVDKVVSLKKVEYYKNNPLPLSYGRGNGLKKDIQRANESDNAIGELFVQGGERNIDRSKYLSDSLHLPAGQSLSYDGEHFEGVADFNAAKARTYTVDENGYGLIRTSPARSTAYESSLDLSDTYPHKDHTIKRVILVNAKEHWYDIVLDAPEDLDYREWQIGGETPTLIFQDGMLAGKEFNLETGDNGTLTLSKFYDDSGKFIGWRFQIVPQEIDGQTMPNAPFIPTEGGIVRIFGIQLPTQYICDNENKSGAEWDMFREAVKYMYDNEEQHFTIKADLDGIWSKERWDDVEKYMRLGAFISFTDPEVQTEGMLIRVTGIKQYVNNPFSPEITLSNKVASGSVSQALREIENSRYDTEQLFQDSINYSKRNFLNANETAKMLEGAMAGFTEQISPVAVMTMQLLIGDESLQYRFITSRSVRTPVDFVPTFNKITKQISCPLSYLQHYTLGLPKVLTNKSNQSTDYPVWTIDAFYSSALNDEKEAYYLYARVKKTSYTSNNLFLLSKETLTLEDGDCYNLLVGIVNSETNGDRAFAPLYGFTEILPGRISADKIVANDTLLADNAHIGKWTHRGGKLYSDDGNIVLDATSPLISLGLRLLLQPNSLRFFKDDAKTSVALEVSGETVGDFDDIPDALDVNVSPSNDGTYTGYFEQAYNPKINMYSIKLDSNGYSDELTHLWDIGYIKSGQIVISDGGASYIVPKAERTDAKHDGEKVSISGGLVVKLDLLEDGVSVYSKVEEEPRIYESEENVGLQVVRNTFEYNVDKNKRAYYQVKVSCQASLDLSDDKYVGIVSATLNTSFTAKSYVEEKTLLAPDGFRSLWGDGFFFFDKDNFVVRKGQNMLKVSKDGSMISKNGGASWTEIGSGSGGGGGSVIVDSELSMSSHNPVWNSAITAGINNRQPLLVSGQNIRTINGKSILGNGNMSLAEQDIEARLRTIPTLTTAMSYTLHISHPLIGRDECEVVLMVFSKRTCRKKGSMKEHKKKWSVALGNHRYFGHSPLLIQSDSISFDELRDYIIPRYCTLSGYTEEQMSGYTYAMWEADTTSSNRGFREGKDGYKRFGIAVRYVNPAFTALVNGSKTLKEETQSINGVPRYLYSPVAPLDAILESDDANRPNHRKMFFGVLGIK